MLAEQPDSSILESSIPFYIVLLLIRSLCNARQGSCFRLSTCESELQNVTSRERCAPQMSALPQLLWHCYSRSFSTATASLCLISAMGRHCHWNGSASGNCARATRPGKRNCWGAFTPVASGRIPKLCPKPCRTRRKQNYDPWSVSIPFRPHKCWRCR